MHLRLGFSTCPNDTFIFDAMAHQKIDTEGLDFDVALADVEELNKQAFEGVLDITKLSFHAYAYISEKYRILDSGSALGHKNGPLLISKLKIFPDEVNDLRIAIPGKNTTANLLLGIAYPEAKNKIEYLFSDIEEAVLENEVDAGLIIHENRFTYAKRGLRKIADMGEFWEENYKQPIPLGCIVVNRKFPLEIQQKVNRIMKRSVAFALKNPEETYNYVKQYAQEMNKEVMYNHIKLFVNEYTSSLGEKGRIAINKLYEVAREKNVIPPIKNDIFV